jgi:hypothetical protein
MSTKSSTVTIGKKSMDAIWAEVAADVIEQTPPPGAISASGFAAKYGCSIDMANSKLSRLSKAGKLTAKSYRVRIDHRLRNVIHYLPVIG